MALTAFGLCVLLSCLTNCIFAFPLDAIQSATPSEEVVVVTQVVTSSVEVFQTSTIVLGQVAATPPALIPQASTPINSLPLPPSDDVVTSTVSAPPLVVTDVVTITATSTPPPLTITLAVPPATVTQIVTIFPSSPLPAPSNTSQTMWSAPAQMTDLSSFGITSFAYGENNMAIVDGVPPEAHSETVPVAAVLGDATAGQNTTASGEVPPEWVNSSAVLQLFYPAGSINPESDPQGGADFYASPLDIRKANNVTLEYSVFFPDDFDWVLAGKLPGLYGGHRTCSGGDDAKSCFSTRLMWRENGAGELYLYAPKDKQTESLCSAPPISVCDQEYGLSIGRGSFNFTPGAWTHVKQTVSLNTPGSQDGQFVLEVNGQEVMHRSDVFYRDVALETAPLDDNDDEGDGDGLGEDEPASSGADDKQKDQPPPQSPPPNIPPAPSEPPAEPLAPIPLLGPLLNGFGLRMANSLLSSLNARNDDMALLLGGPNSPALLVSSSEDGAQLTTFTSSATVTVVANAETQTVIVQPTTTATAFAVDPDECSDNEAVFQTQQQAAEPIGFTGLFFSSFFGGHEEKYASPKDQYTWFKDFAMAINV